MRRKDRRKRGERVNREGRKGGTQKRNKGRKSSDGGREGK